MRHSNLPIGEHFCGLTDEVTNENLICSVRTRSGVRITSGRVQQKFIHFHVVLQSSVSKRKFNVPQSLATEIYIFYEFLHIGLGFQKTLAHTPL